MMRRFVLSIRSASLFSRTIAYYGMRKRTKFSIEATWIESNHFFSFFFLLHDKCIAFRMHLSCCMHCHFIGGGSRRTTRIRWTRCVKCNDCDATNKSTWHNESKEWPTFSITKHFFSLEKVCDWRRETGFKRMCNSLNGLGTMDGNPSDELFFSFLFFTGEKRCVCTEN